MRTRGIVALIAAGALITGAAPALAGKQVKIKPNPVKQGKKLTITAADCVSNGHTAYVQVRIVDSDGSDIKRMYRESTGDPTKLKIKMKRRRWLPEKYDVYVTCIHEFPDLTTGVWWIDGGSFRVKRSS
jgi:hypothetical protein